MFGLLFPLKRGNIISECHQPTSRGDVEYFITARRVILQNIRLWVPSMFQLKNHFIFRGILLQSLAPRVLLVPCPFKTRHNPHPPTPSSYFCLEKRGILFRVTLFRNDTILPPPPPPASWCDPPLAIPHSALMLGASSSEGSGGETASKAGLSSWLMSQTPSPIYKQPPTISSLLLPPPQFISNLVGFELDAHL